MRARTRGATALLVVMAGLIAAVAAGCSDAPVPTQPGTITVKYGPYTIPAAANGVMGMITNSIQMGVQKPCSDCYLTGMQAGLITPSGTDANVDDGLWLHHMVMFDTGQQDLTCPVGLGSLGQRFFSSGNERTPTRSANSGKFGYPVKKADQFNLIYDLMNMTATAQQVYLTVTYDYVPLSTPGYKPVTPVWLDVNQCLTSEVPAKEGVYQYDYSVTSTLNGKLLGIGGHLHDTGINLEIKQNGNVVCNSVAGYGETPDYIEGPASTAMPGMAHLSSMSTCQGTEANPVATIHSGDQISITAHYDSNSHGGSMHHHAGGAADPVMGIAIGYLTLT